MNQSHTENNKPHHLKRLALAFHEAGHAVVAIKLGLTAHSASIESDDESFGRVMTAGVMAYQFDNNREKRAIAKASIVASYAGLQAERLVDPNAPIEHAGQDESDALRISMQHEVFPRYLESVADEYHRAYLEKLRVEARRSVKRFRQAIEAVAVALLTKSRLEGGEIAKIVDRVK